MASRNTTLVPAVPSPRPPSARVRASQSPGWPQRAGQDVASQNASTGLAPGRQPTAMAAIRPAGSSTATRLPAGQLNVQSPTAVPSAKVTSTASQ